MDPEYIIGITAIVALFVVLPGMVFHYITLWRKQKTLMPDDERMLEDLWRSAKAMQRRIETLERLIEDGSEEEGRDVRPSRPTYED